MNKIVYLDLDLQYPKLSRQEFFALFSFLAFHLQFNSLIYFVLLLGLHKQLLNMR